MNLSRVIKQLSDQVTVEETFLFHAAKGSGKSKPCPPECEQCAARRELVAELQCAILVLRREAT
jgi:predicted metal-binding protein